VNEFAVADERAVREVHNAWIDAVDAGDLDSLLALMTDDAIFLNPGHEPFGRDGFRARFLAGHQQFGIHCTSELKEVVVVAGVAHAMSSDSVSLTPRDGGEMSHLAGYRLTIYRKQPDGRWLLARDAHTLSAVAS
jgi:uncharacterized protein (TIGR02246 family)